MSVKFLDNLDLVGNQLQNVILDVKASTPASLGTGQMYYGAYSGVAGVVINKGLKGGFHGMLSKALSDVVVPGSLLMNSVGVGVTNAYVMSNSPVTYKTEGWQGDSDAYLEVTANQLFKNDILISSDLIAGVSGTGTTGQLLSSNGVGNGIKWMDAPVSYTKWILTGDTGTQDVLDGNTVKVAGGSNITTTVAATDTVTVNLASTINIGSLTASDNVQSSFAGQVTIPTTPVASTDAASKGYVDSVTAGGLIYQGGYNANTNTPNLETPNPNKILKGWTYTVTADGLFFTEQVRVGDLLIAEQDAPTALASWTTVQNNIDLASSTQVGIGNVAGTIGGGIFVDYSNGTASLNIATTSLDRATLTLTDSIIVTSTSKNNKQATLAELQTAIGGGGGFVKQSEGTVHTIQHDLGTEYVMVEVIDPSDFSTVYATVTRPDKNVVIVTTAKTAEIIVMVKKVL